VERLAGQALSVDPLAREGAVLCTTIQKFKGLESDVVILVDVRADDLFCGRAFLYTAAAAGAGAPARVRGALSGRGGPGRPSKASRPLAPVVGDDTSARDQRETGTLITILRTVVAPP